MLTLEYVAAIVRSTVNKLMKCYAQSIYPELIQHA